MCDCLLLIVCVHNIIISRVHDGEVEAHNEAGQLSEAREGKPMEGRIDGALGGGVAIVC